MKKYNLSDLQDLLVNIKAGNEPLVQNEKQAINYLKFIQNHLRTIKLGDDYGFFEVPLVSACSRIEKGETIDEALEQSIKYTSEIIRMSYAS